MTLRFGGRGGRLLAWLGLALASTSALTNNNRGLGLDTSFGAGGFVAVLNWPSIDSGTQPVALGLAHMDVSGGYLAATLQRVGGNWRMVLSRYPEAGAVDTGWV